MTDTIKYFEGGFIPKQGMICKDGTVKIMAMVQQATQEQINKMFELAESATAVPDDVTIAGGCCVSDKHLFSGFVYNGKTFESKELKDMYFRIVYPRMFNN